eukprot:TRINITY_DN56558_c0_g1_i1.p1 TRINITY_DN56558_c0_g1~~TRINITY_DN56558_c0_g1_i1.p1  ORF type:complete len:671 (-),score=159.40 TRINITY_DN56558_c0_g1_i1:38-1987(-)
MVTSNVVGHDVGSFDQWSKEVPHMQQEARTHAFKTTQLHPGAAGRRTIAVIFDASAAACAAALRVIRLREESLPSGEATVELIPWPSARAEPLLRAAADRLREMNLGADYAMRGKMVAVLPSGLVIPDCHEDVMQLIYEMESMSMVLPPSPETAAVVGRHAAKLERLRLEGSPGCWWRGDAAVSTAADCLAEASFCILDDFLPERLAEELAAAIWTKRPTGRVPAEGLNGWTRGGTARAAEVLSDGAEGSAAVRQERLARTLLGHARGDILRYADGDAAMAGTAGLLAATDALIEALRAQPRLAGRLEHVAFANSAMFTVYPGDAARYIKHTDNSLMTDGRRLTVILYLNKGWEPADGGCLRLFEPTMQSMRTKRDVEPIWNRLVAFWSTDEVPHEVLSSFRDRAAVSIWYICARESLGTEDAFKRIIGRTRCIGREDRIARLVAAAETEEQRKLLLGLGDGGGGGRCAGVDASELLAAVAADFGGCERFRRLRAHLDGIFGWSRREAEVARATAEAGERGLQLFDALGLPEPPPGVAPARQRTTLPSCLEGNPRSTTTLGAGCDNQPSSVDGARVLRQDGGRAGSALAGCTSHDGGQSTRAAGYISHDDCSQSGFVGNSGVVETGYRHFVSQIPGVPWPLPTTWETVD